MRVFFNAIVVQVLLSAYVLWWGWKALPSRKLVRIPFAVFFVAELIIYLTGFFASRHLPFDMLHTAAWIGTSWMVFICYLAVPLIIYDVVRFVNKKKKFIADKYDLNRRKMRFYYYFSALAIVLAVMVYGNYCFRHPEVTEMSLTVEKYSPNVKELKIVVATDVHAGFLINKPILNKYVGLIMEQKPDLILLVGDIIDYDVRSVELQDMHEEFLKLKAPYGVYAATGNHEYISLKDEEPEAKVKWLSEKAGLTVLRDEVVMVDSSFYIVGREDDKFEGRKPLTNIMKDVNRQYPVIVMNHEPHNLDEEVQAGADIALYGHTHNGQIFPNNILIKRLYELAYGYTKKENTHIYVSSGLGLAGPQYRIATKSEIAVLNVKFDK